VSGRVAGKVVAITGGASGLGEATARLMAGEGAAVLVADIQDDRGQGLAAEIGGRYVHCDVTREADVAGLVDTAVREHGRLDCMFNNAGILGAVGPIADTDASAWLRSMDVLLNSVFYGIKHAAKVMIPQGGGTVINTTSTAGLRAGLGPHAYTAAKHGVVGLTQSVATELGRHGIRVNAIAPGATVSGMTAYVSTGDASALDEASKRIASKVPLGRPGYPIDIANAALYLASDESAWTNGAVLVVDAGGEVIGDRNSRFFAMDSEIVQEAGRKG
jgi:NAD(P)-dependent dehydrogenase (short-subunit alcohol dehydrogenase family)